MLHPDRRPIAQAPEPGDAYDHRVLMLLLPVVAVVVGVLFVVLGAAAVLRDHRRRQDWPTTPGRVVASRLEDGQFRSRVAYVWNGRERAFWNRFTATAVTDPVGREVEVLVNPEDPGDAVVATGLAGGSVVGFALLAFGILALGFAAAWLR